MDLPRDHIYWQTKLSLLDSIQELRSQHEALLKGKSSDQKSQRRAELQNQISKLESLYYGE